MSLSLLTENMDHSQEELFEETTESVCDLCGQTLEGPGNRIISEDNDPSLELNSVCDACAESIQYESQQMLKADASYATVVQSDDIPSEDRPFACEECGKCFSNKTRLKRHFLIHTDERPFVCNLCSKGYRYKQTYDNHMRGHIGEKLFSCDLCGKRFTERKTMMAHQVIHTGERPYQCLVCNKTFPYKNSLKLHYASHLSKKDPIRSNKYHCNVCDKTFRYKQALISHGSVHTGEQPFSCSDCHLCFKNNKALQNHSCYLKEKSIVHQRVRRYQCSFCCRKFYYESSLNVHLVSCESNRAAELKLNPEKLLSIEHVVDSPEEFAYSSDSSVEILSSTNVSKETDDQQKRKKLACNMCDKKFSDQDSYRNHYISHLQKYFKCGICSKNFQSEEERDDHYSVHPNEKSHVCKVCSRAFTKKSQLTNHMSSHEKQIKYFCFFCSKCFLNDNDLAVHYLEHSVNSQPED